MLQLQRLFLGHLGELLPFGLLLFHLQILLGAALLGQDLLLKTLQEAHDHLSGVLFEVGLTVLGEVTVLVLKRDLGDP